MARKIRENEALLERLLVETGEERAYLSGGYVVSRSREGPPQVRRVVAGGGFEQLSIDDAASERVEAATDRRSRQEALCIGVEICVAPI